MRACKADTILSMRFWEQKFSLKTHFSYALFERTISLTVPDPPPLLTQNALTFLLESYEVRYSTSHTWFSIDEKIPIPAII